ncbi:PhzF family phenazine biosynthesis protein [Salibacterium aidingense]|uniref:PhzF family phenazine biosynthesis protein n=1 Tax=Salibacterium aidingense TaxID=384933 RepID=UPI00042784C1|nr:PhzF family phenazine biosynthesis protein [Salibacterium aidingense]
MDNSAMVSANGNLAAYLLQYNYFNSSYFDYMVEQGYSGPSLIHVKKEGKSNSREFSIEVGGRVFVIAEGSCM